MLPPTSTPLHWHGDTFELPPGAEWLAESELCPHQAFRVGADLYGLQFHPEVTPGIISSWCREDESCGELREAEGPIDPEAHQIRMGEIAEHLVRLDEWRLPSPMKYANDYRFTDLVHCPICTHNVPAQVEEIKKRVRVVPGQKCARCHSTLDAAVVLPQREAA